MNKLVFLVICTIAAEFVTGASIFDSCQQEFQNSSILAHNKYRSMHHVPVVSTNAILQSNSMIYAEKLASTNTFQHSGQKGVGENLAMSWSSAVTSLKNCASIYN